MTTEDTAPKRSGLGWIPKLSLWAVVIAFGYLYLSSVDRNPGADTTQAAVADESGVEADGFRKIVDKVGELASSAETVIADVTAAGADGFKQVVDTVKELTGATDPESDATLASDAAPTEAAPAQAAAATPAVVEASPAPQETVAAPVAALAVGDRPAASGFDHHYAPLPATSAARATSPEPDASLRGSTPAAAMTESPPMKDAEATVFAESLMHDAPPAETASAPIDAAAPAPATIPQGFAPAPMMPVVPRPYAQTEAAPAPNMVAPGAAAFERRQESADQYRARMMAEYENMRRVADQRAREYWERMQAPAPMAAPMGYPAYGPAYGPAYSAPAYPR